MQCFLQAQNNRFLLVELESCEGEPPDKCDKTLYLRGEKTDIKAEICTVQALATGTKGEQNLFENQTKALLQK